MSATGQLLAKQRADVAAQVGGEITQILVDEGADRRRGHGRDRDRPGSTQDRSRPRARPRGRSRLRARGGRTPEQARPGARDARHRLARAAGPGANQSRGLALAPAGGASGSGRRRARHRRLARDDAIRGRDRPPLRLARRVRAARPEALRAGLARPGRGRVHASRIRREPAGPGPAARSQRRALPWRGLPRDRLDDLADRRRAHPHDSREGAAARIRTIGCGRDCSRARSSASRGARTWC